MSEPKVEEFPNRTEQCEEPFFEAVPAVKSKRPEKLTEKALLAKISDLEKARKSSLNKAGNVKEQIYNLISSDGPLEEVNNLFSKYEFVVDEAKCTHQSLLKL